MISKNYILILCVICVIFVLFSDGQLLFETPDTNPDRQSTSHDRKPIESDKCAEGELLYPGDNVKDWVCDCKPVYLYSPKTSKCYEAYKKGPCAPNQIFLLKPPKHIPECVSNRCSPGKVQFNNGCFELSKYDGCQQPAGLKIHKLGVNPRTLQLECSRFEIPPRIDTNEEDKNKEVIAYENGCFIGGKRSQNGTCQH